MSLRSFAVVIALLASLSVRCYGAEDRVKIEAKINGAPVHLIFDSGAGVDVLLWPETAGRLGLKVTPFPPGPKPPGADVKWVPHELTRWSKGVAGDEASERRGGIEGSYS